jgi:serine/threonine protein kinase
MHAAPAPDDALAQRLPLPLAQLYRRALAAPRPRERHLEALYLWEAALRLLGSVALVQYAALWPGKSDLCWAPRLARPNAGLWWETVGVLVPLLAEHGDPHFERAREVLFRGTPADFPAVAVLQAALDELGEGRREPETAVPLELLFSKLVAYRNRELGHGVDWQRSFEVYARVGNLLLQAAAEVFTRLDVLAGRRLLYLTNLRASANVVPVLDQFELIGEVPARMPPLEYDANATGLPPRPDRLYLMNPADAPHSPGPFGVRGLLPLDPLVHYDPETGEVFFFHRGRGGRPPEYTCYTTGRFTSRRDPDIESLPLVGQVLDIQPPLPALPPPEPPQQPLPPMESRRPSQEDTGEAAPPPAVPPPAAEPITKEAATWEPPSAEPPAAGPGRRFGEFVVVHELGQGNTGIVWSGWQPVLERPVALKCLLPQAAQDQDIRNRFLREARILGRVSHPGLVQVYGSGIIDGCLYYAREWIEGTSLEDLSRRLHEEGHGPADLDLRAWYQTLSKACGTFPPTNLDTMAGRPLFGRLAELVRQVAGAAHALHQAGFVHRNIGPDNILVTADGTRAVLIGLGCAKEGVHEGGLTREFVASLPYASPDQLGTEERIDGRSDVYSLGVTLWELLTLRPMYGATEQTPYTEIVQRIMVGEAEGVRRYNREVPKDMEAIVLKCLAKNREQRYASARALAEDLERFLNGKPVAARPRPFLERVAGWWRRPPRLADVAPLMPAAPSRRPPSPAPPEEDRPASVPRPAAEPKTAPRPPRTQPAAPVPPSSIAPDQVFSSQTVVTLYPAPIAITYRRFCQETHPRSRLEALFCVLEASVRYLLTLGISDLFGSLVETGGDPAEALAHADFEFLKRPQRMLLGKWVGALRETARALAAMPASARMVGELPEVCRPGGPLDAELLAWLVGRRNDCVHTDGSIRLPDEKCREVLREYRPRLEEFLREVRFVCRYPLGFITAFAGLSVPAGEHYYHLHSCMGAWVGATSRALDLKTSAQLREELPFVAAPDGRRLLHLWPLLLQRRSEYTGRRTLFVFQEIPDHRRPFLTTVRSAAIDLPETWSADLHPEPAAGHAWLLARLRQLPPAPAVPAELGLADKLLPARGGRLVGQEVGSNRLLSVVAVGGFGTIYAAEALDGERVAVKVIESRPTAVQMARFSQEIAKLRLAADYPGIIRLFEHGDVDVDGRICPWYSMEFALGGDLRSRIDRRRAGALERPPWEDPAARAEVCAEFTAVAEAVAHLHRLRIVHRDVKPGNVLIMGDGSLRLSDFGLVRNLEPTEETLRHGPHSATGEGAGTPGYMAPEQARGQDAREPADVYALGILLAELALGERPRTELPPALADGRLPSGSTLKKCPSLNRLPAVLRELVQRCTDADPDRRPEDAGAVLRAFSELASATQPPAGGVSSSSSSPSSS